MVVMTWAAILSLGSRIRRPPRPGTDWTKDEPVFPFLNLDKPQVDEEESYEYDSDESDSDELPITDRWYPLRLAVMCGHDEIALNFCSTRARICDGVRSVYRCKREMLNSVDRDMLKKYDYRMEDAERRVPEDGL